MEMRGSKFSEATEVDFLHMTESMPSNIRQKEEESASRRTVSGPMIAEEFPEKRQQSKIERVCCGWFPLVVRLVLCASAGSLLFGLNVAILNTSLNTISSEFGWCDIPAKTSCRNAVVMKAFVSTAVFIGAAVGAMTAGRLLSIGRRMLILVDMVVFALGAISTIVSTSFSSILWGRLITGYAVGIVSIIVPIYISEMSPAHSRGSYGVFHQLFITIGVFLGVLLGLPLQPHPADNDPQYLTFVLRTFDKIWWRIMIGISLIPVLVVVIFLGYVFFFETPHYNVEYGKPVESLLKELYSKGDVDDELSQIVKAREMAIQAKHQGLTFFVAMKTPTYRRVILIGCLLAAFQQFIGINVFVATSNKLFTEAGLKVEIVTLMSTILAFINVLVTFPAILLVEKLGRRYLMILGNLGMALGVLPGAICFWIDSTASYTTWLAIVGAILFIIFYGVSYGPVLWVYLFEIYPIEIKGLGCGLATAVNWICAVGMVFTANFVPTKINYTIFCGMAFIAALISYCLMRETKGLTLEQSPFFVEGNV